MIYWRCLKGLAVLAALYAVPLGFFMVKRYFSPPPEINQAAMPALRTIEERCLNELPGKHATVACLTVRTAKKNCDDHEDCTLEQYYCALYRAGFDDDLPNLYQGRPNPC